MVTIEKLSWIKKNLERGDRKEIADSLDLNYYVVYDILSGKLKGVHKEAVIKAAEDKILKRQKQRAKDRKKYGTADSRINQK